MSQSTDKRAFSFKQLLNTNFNVLEFTGEWLESLGKPELCGTWIIYGPPKHGKTRFSVQLAKYLTHFTRVAYDTLEEGKSESLKKTVREVNFTPKELSRMLGLEKERIDDLRVRLKKKKSPKVIFIDSIQYTGMNYKEYISLKDEFPHKLFIYISHADGKLPAGQVARRVQFDANIYIRVEGFKAYPRSRYGGGAPFTIWPEGAIQYE